MRFRLFAVALATIALTAATPRLAQAQSSQSALHIVGPSVVGIRPGTPFVHLIGVSAREPSLRFSARGLPRGLQLDERTGVISGDAPETAASYDVQLTVRGRGGAASSTLRIVVGDALALTPPMGWNSWNSFEKEISETVVYEIADALERSGLRDAGYVYINLDDHWAALNRELVVYQNNVRAEWRMVPHRERFPNDLKPVANSLHARGFKLGVYSDAGVTTCAEAQPAGYGYEEVDARTFAEWGVDYVKYDYCYAPADRASAIDRYTRMGRALEATNRSIVYSICEWGVRAPWEWARQAGGHLWRTTGDMRAHWEYAAGREPVRRGGIGILDAADLQVGLERHQRPGAWNDPDMLIVGVGLTNSAAHLGAQGLNPVEERSMMSLWALMGAPLIINADVRKLDPQSSHYDAAWAARILPMLRNHELIAIDQDPAGAQGTRVAFDGDADVWAKPMSDGSIAVGLLNRGATNAMSITVRWSDLGIRGSYRVRDVWAQRDLGRSDREWAMQVAPHETALLQLYPANR